MYFIGIPYFPVLLFDFTPILCLRTSSTLIGDKKKEFELLLILKAVNRGGVLEDVLGLDDVLEDTF